MFDSLSKNLKKERRSKVRRSKQRRDADRYLLPEAIPVRFFVGDVEVEGALIDVSVSGMRIAAPFTPEVGSKIRLYIDQLGRLDGAVARRTENGFSIKADINESETRRLHAWLQQVRKSGAGDRRIFGRRSSDHPVMRLKDVVGVRSDGTQFPCKLVNLSTRGVEIRTEIELAVGERLILNGTTASVKGKTENGYKIAHCSEESIEKKK